VDECLIQFSIRLTHNACGKGSHLLCKLQLRGKCYVHFLILGPEMVSHTTLLYSVGIVKQVVSQQNADDGAPNGRKA